MPELKFFYGPMDCGKSTLALQMDYSLRRTRRGILLTSQDRSGEARITSRIGLEKEALEVTPETNLFELVRHHQSRGGLDYAIADEAQFYTVDQVEQLCHVVDELGVEVLAFGITTDFKSCMFPGSKRLMELADVRQPLQVETLCWCGSVGSQNARVVDDVMVTEGEQVVVGDTDSSAVRYVVVCRKHFFQRRLG